MFEKEAEEYLKRDGTNAEKILNKANLSLNKEQAVVLLNAITQVFKDGAEFGYNKANEWRKDIPSNDNAILCQIAKDEFEVGYYHTEKKRFYTMDGEEIDVIQWQEIIPPKLEEAD